MPYNKKNKLKLIARIQTVYREHQREGVTTVFIYRKHIAPVYHIGLRTFYNYLATNVKQEEKKYLMQGVKLQINKVQWSVFIDLLQSVAENAPIEDYEVESCVLAELYKRKITSFTFFRPNSKKIMAITISPAEAYSLHYLCCTQVSYNSHLRLIVEPFLPPAKTKIH